MITPAPERDFNVEFSLFSIPLLDFPNCDSVQAGSPGLSTTRTEVNLVRGFNPSRTRQQNKLISYEYYPRDLRPVHRYTNSQPSDEAQFKALAERWRRETGRLSVMALRYTNEAYQKILTMGQKAVPFMLRELRDGRDRWFSTLQLITDAHPSPTKQSDPYDVAVEAWVKWGRDHGYDV